MKQNGLVLEQFNVSLRERNVSNVGLVLSLDPFPSIINKDDRVTFQDISGRTILQTCKGQKKKRFRRY